MDKYLTFARACREEIPQLNGRPVAPNTPWRWATKGLRGVYLKHRRIGHRCVTTREWLDEFFEALASAEPPSREPAPKPSVPRQRTPKQRQRDIEQAERRMAVGNRN
jgi:hypothetical protein